MASQAGSPYFPPLDKCLNGDIFLISWKLVFSTITSSDGLGDADRAPIELFLREQVKQPKKDGTVGYKPGIAGSLLLKPYEAFPHPTPESRKEFEAKTSAINATPSPDAKYDINEIKEDALWLSKVANLDEITALRVVIIECQSRSAARLLSLFSEEELVNIRGAAGNIKYSSPLPASLLSHGQEAADIQKEFDSPDSRKQRILHTYLSERRHLLKSSEVLFESFFISKDNEGNSPKGKGPLIPESWVAKVATFIIEQTEKDQIPKILLSFVKSIGHTSKCLETGSGWFADDGGREAIEVEWVRSQMIETIHNMEILWHFLVYVIGTPSSQFVLDWSRLLQSFGFFNSFDSTDEVAQALFSALQSLSSVITVSIFGDENCLAILSEVQSNDEVVTSRTILDQPFVLNYQTLSDVHNIILQAAEIGFPIAGPAILAWSILLQTMQLRVDSEIRAREESEVEDHSVAIPYQSVFEQIQGTAEEDVVDFLARQAVNQCHVFDTLYALSGRLGSTQTSFASNRSSGQMRESILGLIKGTLGIGYIPEILEATISALSGGKGYWEIVDSDLLVMDDPVSKFLQDDDMTMSLLSAAQSRYPFESLPFLQLVRALATSPNCYSSLDSESIMHLLSNMTHFTYELPANFTDYETTHEEENNNNIRLSRTIHLFTARSKLMHSVVQRPESFAVTKADEDFYISAGTSGRIVSESGPRVAFWFHEYSALKYFGKILETFLRTSDEVDGITGMPPDRDSVSEIIGLFATILLSITRSSDSDLNWFEATSLVLQGASAGLSRNRDIITVVFDIFEEELHNQSLGSISESHLEILIGCVQFIHAILPLAPGRVWPFMAKTDLLGLARGGGKLSSIVEGVELPAGRFPFLISCCRLFESLIDDAAANGLRRKSGSRCTVKFDGVSDIRSGIPEQVLSQILLSFTRYSINVLENSSAWRFVSDDERRYLAGTIGKTLDKILRYGYGLGRHADESSDSSDLSGDGTMKKAMKRIMKESQSLLGAMMLSASHIADNFLSASSGPLRFQPLLRAFFDGLETPSCTVYYKQSALWKAQVVALLNLSTSLIRISTLLRRPSSQLELQLFKTCPIIARLYAANDTYQVPALSLLESLVVGAATSASEPPSLLGHLGPRTTKNLLHVLSDLNKPLVKDQNLTSTWRFLAMIISCRQQWVANYLLTGKSLDNFSRTQDAGTKPVNPRSSFLTIALESLSKIEELSRVEASTMLEFTALAQNFWPWNVCEHPKFSDFIKAVLEYAGNLTPPQLRAPSLEGQIEACYQLKIAAYIAEILAMHLFHSRQTGRSVDMKDILPNLSFFERFAAAAPYYNASLHSLLKRNFTVRYPGCEIDDIKRVILEERKFGIDYFYDVSLADQMLKLDQAWTGRNANGGMKGELERANVNLSLVDAQIALFHSWKYLLIELSGRTSSEPGMPKMFLQTINACLTVDAQPQPPEDIFSRLTQTKADLALVLAQGLLNGNRSMDEMQGLLTTVWSTIRTLRGNFERPVPEDDMLYYRSLLKVLFLAIRIHAEAKPAATDDKSRMTLRIKQISDVTPIILDILRYVVSNGIREIVTVIHDSPSDSTPEDLALLTGIMQSCLRVPSVESCHSQIVTIMTSNETARLALTLFSWSDNLSIDGDPIYGELSILFILELSSMPSMAEQLAISGILGSLSAANITSYLRRPGVGPFATSTGLQRCYSIWARGLLPLLLNLLDAVQHAIACDVALFLEQFPILLAASAEALDAPIVTRLPDTAPKKFLTLTTCSEVHSLALVTYILSGFRDNLHGTLAIPDVKWDGSAVLEDVEFWLSSRALLRDRILPMGEREMLLAGRKLGDGKDGNATAAVGNELEKKVMAELMGIRDVLSGGDTS